MSFEKWVPQPDFDNFPASATIVQSRLIRLPSPVANMLRLSEIIRRLDPSKQPNRFKADPFYVVPRPLQLETKKGEVEDGAASIDVDVDGSIRLGGEIEVDGVVENGNGVDLNRRIDGGDDVSQLYLELDLVVGHIEVRQEEAA